MTSDIDLNKFFALQLYLSPHVSISTQHIRQETWFILSNNLNDKQMRIPPETMHLIGCLGRGQSLARAVESARQQTEETQFASAPAFSHDDVIRLIFSLQEMGMLAGDIAFFIQPKSQQQGLSGWQQRLLRPLAIQIPLLNPSRLLDTLAPLAERLFGAKLFWTLIALIVIAALVAIGETAELKRHFDARFFDPANLISLWFIYPLLKGLHELAHGLTCRWRGGHVKEMGIMLLVFVPVPYVNATSANTFSKKSDRILVAAAGILVELCLAAIAMLLWWQLPDGILRDIAFNVAMIGSVSTLLFNGNPLLKFDGYYILEEQVEIPGLASRSNRYLGYLIKRYGFQLHTARAPNTASGETGWFVIYGLTSGIYRIVLSFSIAFYVAGKFFAVGVLLAVWYLIYQILLPGVKNIIALLKLSADENNLSRSLSLLMLALCLPVVLLVWVPVPNTTLAEGIIIVPEEKSIRTSVEGFLVKLPRTTGDIEAGDVVAYLRNDEIERDYRLALADLSEARVEYARSIGNNATQASIEQEEVDYLTEQVALAKKQLDGLTIRANASDQYSSFLTEDDLGKFFQRGELVGQLGDNNTPVVQVVIPQRAIDAVRSNSRSIQARVSGFQQKVVEATELREVPKISNQLPSRALGSAAGGSLPLDMRDGSGFTTKVPFFLIEVLLPGNTISYNIGQKVVLKFRHDSAPIALQLYDRLSIALSNQLQSNT